VRHFFLRLREGGVVTVTSCYTITQHIYFQFLIVGGFYSEVALQ
jgi:hypothetical protein